MIIERVDVAGGYVWNCRIVSERKPVEAKKGQQATKEKDVSCYSKFPKSRGCHVYQCVLKWSVLIAVEEFEFDSRYSDDIAG